MQLAILTGSMHGWLLVQDVQAAFEAAFKAACRHRNGTCMACMACMVMLESMLCLGQPANLMQSMHGFHPSKDTVKKSIHLTVLPCL